MEGKHYRGERKALRLLFLFLVIGTALAFIVQASQTQTVYIITDGPRVMTHTSFSQNPEEVLREAGLTLGPRDVFTFASLDDRNVITVSRLQRVYVTNGGETMTLETYGEPVKSLLAGLHIRAGENVLVSRDLSDMTYDGMELTITYLETEEHEEILPVPFETVYRPDPTLSPGSERVLTPGREGRLLRRTRICYENGSPTETALMEERLLTHPVTEVMLRGVERTLPEEKALIKSAAPEASFLDTLSYSRVLSVEATAYSCEGYTGITATGTVARYGAIAVDPTVIPYGTSMYIVSDDGVYIYGYATAEDCGGGIKGNRIDLYFDTVDECWEFGRRACTVYILD